MARIWYRRGKYWYLQPTGSAPAHELCTCANPACGDLFFGRRQRKYPERGRFCSIRCSRERDLNPQWRGDAVRYRAAHVRVARSRGKAAECSIPECVTGSKSFHWASLSGRLSDPADYAAMCVFHHRAYDWAQILGFSAAKALEMVGQIDPDYQRMRSRFRTVDAEDRSV